LAVTWRIDRPAEPFYLWSITEQQTKAQHKEAEMRALNSGLFFVSAMASNSGMSTLSQEALKLRTPRKAKKLAKRRSANYTPLSTRQKEELMQSILHDDWRE
jgi:hypothetical protein